MFLKILQKGTQQQIYVHNNKIQYTFYDGICKEFEVIVNPLTVFVCFVLSVLWQSDIDRCMPGNNCKKQNILL